MIRILIIEDEEPIRRVLVRILSEEDRQYEITEAIDGKKGFDLLQKRTFDLVLCDIKMPNMDGIEVLQKANSKIISVTLKILFKYWSNVFLLIDKF